MTRLAVAAALAAALLASGCGSDDGAKAVDRSPTPPTGSACPGALQAGAEWADGVPDSVPLPDGSRMEHSDHSGGVQHVYFTAPMSFTESVRYYLAELPKAGFVVEAGDSEESEADIPFGDGGQKFSLKLRGVPDPCRTEGLLTVGAAQTEETD